MTDAPDVAVDTVKGWYAAFDSRSLAALCALAHPEIEVVPASPLLARLPGASFHGHLGLRTLMAWAYEHYPGVRVGSTVVRHVPAGLFATTTYDAGDGSEASGRGWAVFRLLEGKVFRVHAFARESDALAFASSASVLTSREREVLQLLARGLTGTEIAEALVVSPGTVRTHVQNAMGRLGAKTRTEAVARALKRGDITF